MASGMGDVALDFFAGAPGDRLKFTSTVIVCLGMISTMFVPSTDVALGLAGIISARIRLANAVIVSSMELLNLFLVLAPASVILDCIKLGVVARPKGFGFVVFVEIIVMAVKLVASYFAYTLKKSQEESVMGMGGGGAYQPYQPPGGNMGQYGAPNAPFNPEQPSAGI